MPLAPPPPCGARWLRRRRRRRLHSAHSSSAGLAVRKNAATSELGTVATVTAHGESALQSLARVSDHTLLTQQTESRRLSRAYCENQPANLNPRNQLTCGGLRGQMYVILLWYKPSRALSNHKITMPCKKACHCHTTKMVLARPYYTQMRGL